VADGPGSTLIERNVRLPGDRAAVRERTTTLAMHLLRRALLGAVSSAA
jgi:nicotinamide mononucleotide (NMN) deamidase PncC